LKRISVIACFARMMRATDGKRGKRCASFVSDRVPQRNERNHRRGDAPAMSALRGASAMAP
jgi:hypothetical protein